MQGGFMSASKSSGRSRSYIFAAAAAACALSASSQAAQRYIVTLRSPSTFEKIDSEFKTMLSKNALQKDAFGQLLIQRPTLLDTQAKVANTLANLDMVVIEADAADVARLTSNPEVASVEPERFFPAPKVPVEVDNNASADKARRRRTLDSSAEITWGLKAVKAPEAWTQTTVGAQGEGARVAIIDTGIDKDHPDLKNQIEAAKNFVTTRPSSNGISLGAMLMNTLKDVSNADSTTPPYDYFDQVGHGTHVAGTIAAALDGSGVVGVAPKAKILMGRVCGKLGCSSVAILNGINWAIQEKVDVLSMSLGGPFNSPAQEEALNRAKAANIVNVAASGNDGQPSVSYPAANDACVAIGAIDSNLKKADFSNWGPELDVMAPGVDVISSVPMGSGRESKVLVSVNGTMTQVPSTSFVGSFDAETPLTGELAYAGLGKPADFQTASVSGKIALIQRGDITFADKVKNAIAAKAKGVIVYNNVDGAPISGAITEDGSTVAIPVTMIEKSVGEALKAQLDAGQASQASIATLKTDYASFAGTSMATPHVSGVVALIRAANPKLTPDQVEKILKDTAVPTTEDNGQNQYGSGVVNAEAAVKAALGM
jgi:subtilisin family serine protease